MSGSGGRLLEVQREVLSAGTRPCRLEVFHDLDDATWRGVMTWAKDHRVVTFLSHAIGGSGVLLPDQQAELRQVSEGFALQSLNVDASASLVARCLLDDGIPWRVLKGVATARLLYPDPSWRSYGDVDILVHEHDVDRALQCLDHLVAEPAPLQAGPARTWAVKEKAFRDRRGVEIDLHFGVQGSLFSTRLDNDLLFEAPQEVTVCGLRSPTLSWEALFVNAVLHVSSGGWRASTIPDVLRLADRVRPTDERVARLSERPAVRRLLAWALQRTLQWVDLPDDWTDFAGRNAPAGARAKAYAWAHESEERVRVANAFVGPQRLRRITESAWPTAEFLAQEGTTRWGNFSRVFQTGRTAARRSR